MQVEFEVGSREPYSLTLVDSEPVRDSVVARCETALAYLGRLRDEYLRFLRDDLEGFKAWSYATYPKKWTSIRSLQEEIDRCRTWLQWIADEVIQFSISCDKAYQRVQYRYEARCTDSTKTEDDFSSVFGSFEMDPSANRPNLVQEKHPSVRSQDNDDLRYHYRRLARALHPDLNADTPERERMWMETQIAYNMGDLKKLELLSSLVQFSRGERLEDLRVSDLSSVYEQLGERAGLVEQELFRCRQSPAWNFSKIMGRRSELREIRARVRSDLDQSLRRLRSELRMLKSQLKQMARPRERKTYRVTHEDAQMTFSF